MVKSFLAGDIVKCIDASNQCLTEGMLYKVIKSNLYYTGIVNNSGNEAWYLTNRFKLHKREKMSNQQQEEQPKSHLSIEITHKRKYNVLPFPKFMVNSNNDVLYVHRSRDGGAYRYRVLVIKSNNTNTISAECTAVNIDDLSDFHGTISFTQE